ncbi:hypothetical protein HMN09_00763300 [Mycena chlorophos]|uniref:Ribonuclease H2 subunit B n=1 Tax=Mycena chlorophos TaxID=658473 RepID=A0A8H6SWG2_MYCCL|nr:hypothetical protein HMN09_00763300 [Mycena chlorophos]
MTHVAVLPDATPLNSTRFLRLLHPRTELPTLFLATDDILEVQSVSPVNSRSWFIEQEVVSDGKLLVFTPVDPAFLLLPILQSVYPENATGMFRPADEIFEDAATDLDKPSSDASKSITKEDVLYFTSMQCCRRALRCICDVKEITEDIIVYRFSREKVVQYLQKKVARLATPETMEMSRTLVRNLAKDRLLEDGKEDLLKLGRARAACDLLGQYIPPATRGALVASYDFSPLDTYLKSLDDEKEALVVQKTTKAKSAPAPTDNKKRKDTSTGVEKLKKAKTTGMAKLSTFFAKKA